jgi:flagellar hook-associated protein 2
MATITSTGLGTGLNINELVSSLVEAQSAPRTAQLDRLSTSTNSSISAFGQLRSALESFSSSLAGLNSASAFSGFQATSSNEAVATVTADSSAVAGTYQLRVSQLATASRASTGSIESGQTFSAGTLSISLGEGDAMSVDIAEGASLEDVRQAINSQLRGRGVTANIMSNPGNPGEGSRLVLSSSVTGAGNDIRVEGSGDLSALNVSDTQGSYLSRAANAEFELDGVVLSSSSNTVESAVSGLSFELLRETPEGEEATTVGISANTDGLRESLQSFVTAYNSLISVTNGLTRVSTAEGSTSAAGSPLTGSSMVRGLTNTLRSELNRVAEGAGIQSLYELGISTTRSGTLEIDDARLSEALEQNSDSLVGFFTGREGLFTRMDTQVREYTKSGGILASQRTSLDNTLRDITRQRDAHAARMATLEESLFSRFNAMDNLVAQLNSTGNSLLASLESMSNSRNNN